MLKYFTLIAFVLSQQFIMAQIVTDRPDQTESSSTVPLHSVQIEAGILAQFDDANDIYTRELSVPGLLIRYGVLDFLELRVGIANMMQRVDMKINIERYSGMSDLEIGAKVQILEQGDANTEIALLTHFVLPTGLDEFSNDGIGSINKLCFSHEVTESIGIGYNVGYNYLGIGNGDITYSFVMGFGLTDELSFFAEPYGELVDIDVHVSMFNAGFTYLLDDNLQIDISGGLGLNNDIQYISTGISWLIGK